MEMELTNNTKTTPYAQSESSSETHPNSNSNNNKTKSLSLLIHQHHHTMVVSYKECLKNHAATLGGHALDGCGEFMPVSPSEPGSFKCAACGCHRNFHRRDPYDAPAFIHHLPPPLPNNPTSSSPSPTNSTSRSPTHTPPSPVPYSYYSSAPHMLLALSTGYSGGPLDEYNHSNPVVGVTDKNKNSNSNSNKNNTSSKKRSRTKFSKEQKEKMHAFAERVSWRMPRGEEKLLKEFCNEVEVDREVFKVWMHNNKNTIGKKDILTVGNLNLDGNNNNEDDNGNGNAGNSFDSNNNEYCIQLHVTNNGSSSAS